VKTGSRRGLALDLLICAALMVWWAPVTLGFHTSDRTAAGTAWDTILLPAVILPILLRRRSPFAAAVALAAGCVVSGIPTFEQTRFFPAIAAGMLILYSLAAHSERRRALAGLALVLAGMVFIAFTDVLIEDNGGPASMIVFSFALCLGAWAGGRMVRARALVAEQLAARSRSLELQREQTAELAVEVERTQVASALDMAARGRVREIIELADEGERSLGSDAGAAVRAFARIETMGRESLNEMRDLLGVLRSDERGSRAPRPTLAQLETLLAEARRGGRLVDLHVDGERRPLPGGLELAAYRVLQHALVAVRGGDDEPATIELSYLPGALELEVSGLPIEGRGPDVALLAARERVTAHGGSFSADSSPAGRRVLRARLPIVAVHA
jgi:signal transduction histidine kinase